MVLIAWTSVNGVHISSMQGTIVSRTLIIITLCGGMLIIT